jgi:hypothetical protein
MHRWRTLGQLSAALRSAPERNSGWTDILTLANQSLVTPQLARALETCRDVVPDEIQAFLDEVLRRNRERNHRLWSQLNEATAALNAHGVEPGVLKGAAGWIAAPDAAFDRLMSDLDLLVRPAQVETAMTALSAAGFELAGRYSGPAVHVVAEFGRPQDPGYIDLHQRAPGPPALAEAAATVTRRRRTRIPGGWVEAPDAASQLLHLVLHDLFHDGGYWRGGFDLRHLIDAAALAPQIDVEGWTWLKEACGSDLVRGALDAYLLAAHRLIGGFTLGATSASARRTERRWILQYARPVLRLPLAGVALLAEWPRVQAHRRVDRDGRQRLFDETAAAYRPAERLARLRKIFTVEMGKI